MCREKVCSAQPFKSGILEPQAIDKIVIRAQRGPRRRGASDVERKKIIGSKTIEPSGKAGDTEVLLPRRGTDYLWLG